MNDEKYKDLHAIRRDYERAEELKEWRKESDEWRKLELSAKEQPEFAPKGLATYDWINWADVYGATEMEYRLWRKYYTWQYRRQCRQYIIHALMIALAVIGICVLCIYL